eukprot:785-Heterococcus_DN1.PRE.1
MHQYLAMLWHVSAVHLSQETPYGRASLLASSDKQQTLFDDVTVQTVTMTLWTASLCHHNIRYSMRIKLWHVYTVLAYLPLF